MRVELLNKWGEKTTDKHTSKVHLPELRLNHVELDEEGTEVLAKDCGLHCIYDTSQDAISIQRRSKDGVPSNVKRH